MNTHCQWLVCALISGLLLAGCTSKVTDEQQYSGFLPSYAGLQELSSPSGKQVLRWVAPGFAPDTYSTVVFSGLQFYPAPQPDERVNRQTLQDLQAYTNASVKSVLDEKYRVVPSMQEVRPGKKTLILRAAITGVSATNEGMRWYEIVPVAAVVGATEAATGHRDQNTELFIEAEFIDAANGLPLLRVVRKVFGDTLKNASQPVTAADFESAINGMASDMRAQLM
ncbi:DUF3313 domain-containing protein [Pseudomonas sp. PD9R]|uniref:DUF3313 domain-containing protein n=1 Tax=Pseudomonas sp. PD9R TaxID=2853534 RepID=UPI001C440A8F|nr:DUF3313 domain-containing protein [Pseudomonas sp. PD9R]MBV6821774.1 DUF3313 domain-containing protein [Pseudomonas sp. PD9R]